MRLGEGRAQALSPDGKWVLSLVHGSPPKLVLLPTGPGEPRPIPLGEINGMRADLLPDGKRVLVWGSAPGQGWRVFVQDLDGRDRRALPEGFHLFWYGSTVSPDGKLVAIAGPGQKLMLIPIEGGEPRPVPGVERFEAPVGWSEDERFLYVFGSPVELPGRIHRIDLASGRRELWKEIMPRDPAAFGGFGNVTLTPDRKSYAYSLNRYLLHALPGRGTEVRAARRAQKLSRTPNWRFRWGSRLKFAVLLMRPALGLSFPGTPSTRSGSPRFTWLKRLTASTRSSSAAFFVSATLLNSDASTRQ